MGMATPKRTSRKRPHASDATPLAKYREKLIETIEAKAAGKPQPKVRAKAVAKGNVLDLMDLLQKSLAAQKGKRGASKPANDKRTHGAGRGHGKKSAA